MTVDQSPEIINPDIMDGVPDANRVYTLVNYQTRANRFINEDRYNGLLSYLNNTALGLTGEGGEFADIVKKLLFHGHPYSPEVRLKLIKELGDVLWYVAQGCKALDVTLAEVASINIQKLTDRHGLKFSETASLTKDETKEAVGILVTPVTQELVDANLDAEIQARPELYGFTNEDIAIDMLAFAEDCVGSSVEELTPLVADWRRRHPQTFALEHDA